MHKFMHIDLSKYVQINFFYVFRKFGICALDMDDISSREPLDGSTATIIYSIRHAKHIFYHLFTGLGYLFMVY